MSVTVETFKKIVAAMPVITKPDGSQVVEVPAAVWFKICKNQEQTLGMNNLSKGLEI